MTCMLTLLFFDKLTVCPRTQADLADLHVSYDWISIACKHHVSRKVKTDVTNQDLTVFSWQKMAVR